MTKTLERVVELEVLNCGHCGTPHAVPKLLAEASRQQKGVSWYCPMGHVIGYGGTELVIGYGGTELDRVKSELAQWWRFVAARVREVTDEELEHEPAK